MGTPIFFGGSLEYMRKKKKCRRIQESGFEIQGAKTAILSFSPGSWLLE
jgi:hypothetical protein